MGESRRTGNKVAGTVGQIHVGKLNHLPFTQC